MKLSEALFKAGDSIHEDDDLRDLLWKAAGVIEGVEGAPRLGRCCYGGAKPKEDCATCAGWVPGVCDG